MTRAEKVAKAQQMREGGASMREIGKAIGVSHSAVSKWLNPERAREWRRRDNAKRGPAKREEERRSDGPPCPSCGVIRTRSQSRGADRCRACATRLVNAQSRARRDRIADLWNAGASLREIASALASTPASIGVSMAHMRRDGWDLPYRHKRQVAA